MSNANKIFRLLEGFRDSYETFKTTMLRPSNLTYAKIISQIQSYKLRNKKTLSAANPARCNRGNTKVPQPLSIHMDVAFLKPAKMEEIFLHPTLDQTASQANAISLQLSLYAKYIRKKGHEELKCRHRLDKNYQSDDLLQGLTALYISDSYDDEQHPDNKLDTLTNLVPLVPTM